MAPDDAGDAMEPDQAMSGTLYGVGLGPGDPELLTLKAVRLIQSADVLAYPALQGGDSLARSIAEQFIPDGIAEICIDVPMSTAREPAQVAYDTAAEDIRKALDAGKNVVCLCEGDPFFYGSFMYLFARMSKDHAVEVVPGVTSMTACAALAGRPLVARNEVLTVLPGPLPEAELRTRLGSSDTLVMMKVGRHLPKLRHVLEDAGLSENAVYIERATMADEVRLPLSEAPEKAPYFSMILVTKGADPWL